MADLHSKILDARPPGGPNSFNFMQFLGKFGKIVCWHPPGELAPPPRGNPASATEVRLWKGIELRSILRAAFCTQPLPYHIRQILELSCIEVEMLGSSRKSQK